MAADEFDLERKGTMSGMKSPRAGYGLKSGV